MEANSELRLALLASLLILVPLVGNWVKVKVEILIERALLELKELRGESASKECVEALRLEVAQIRETQITGHRRVTDKVEGKLNEECEQ